MSAQIFYNNGSSSSEIITHLVNASDGAGLHFDGTDGNISFTPTDLGTKFSFEFILQADSYTLHSSGATRIIDFGTGGRFLLGWWSGLSNDLSIYSVSTWSSFGVKVLDDLKVHHLVLTVDGTAATLYDNGNQVATATIALPTDLDDCTDARIGSEYNNATNSYNGTIYRARLWNKTLSQTDVTSVYESASIDFADQWGSQTELATNGSFASDTAWTKQTGWTIAGGKAVATSAAADKQLYQARTYTVGKRYRAVFEISGYSAGAIKANLGGASSLYPSGNFNANGTHTYTFVAQTASDYIIFDTVGTTTLNIEYVTLHEVGAVADFDCSYSNPEISTIVQNRNDTVSMDGTAAGGVTQITPIEQLNSKALRVGTSAASPADGELMVSSAGAFGGDVTIGVGGSTPDLIFTEGDSQITGPNNANFLIKSRGNSAAEGLSLHGADGAGIEVNKAGNVGVGVTPVSGSGIARFLHIGGSTAGIVLEDTDGPNKWEQYSAGGNLKWEYNGGSSALSISSAGLASFSAGIAFSGQTDASGTGITSGSSTLNHYEQGTWTPVLTGTAATIPAVNATGIYTRIGNLVFVSWYSGSMTLASSTGSAVITGLPFLISNVESSYSVFSYTHGNAVGGNSRGGYFQRNTSQMGFINDGASGAATFVNGSGKFAMVSGVYQAA